MASEYVLDSSAIVSVLTGEPTANRLVRLIDSDSRLSVGAPTLVEAAIVLSVRLGYDARGVISEFIEEARVGVIPFDHRHYRVAVEAFLHYGKGRHPASLNFGDCLAYAVAAVERRALLFVGEDFKKTDVLAPSN